jgi:hypothetical protein
LEAKTGVKPRCPKGRAPARGLDARLCLQHPLMRAGDASSKTQSKNTLTVITVSTATIACAAQQSPFWPYDILGPLFDHLVGRDQQSGWDGEAERFGGLQVERSFVLDRRLHRKVCGIGAA